MREEEREVEREEEREVEREVERVVERVAKGREGDLVSFFILRGIIPAKGSSKITNFTK